MEWFWKERFWLPSNITWKYLSETNDDKHRTKSEDLYWPLGAALILLILRKLVEQLIIKPIGISLGLKDEKRKPPTPNKILDNAVKGNGVIEQTFHLSLVNAKMF